MVEVVRPFALYSQQETSTVLFEHRPGQVCPSVLCCYDKHRDQLGGKDSFHLTLPGHSPSLEGSQDGSSREEAGGRN